MRFTDFDRLQVWLTAPPAYPNQSGFGEWRLDHFGSLLKWSDHGDRNSPHGWEIDHIVPAALGGTDHPSNLRPLHWRRNAAMGGLLGALMGLQTSNPYLSR